MRTNTFSHLAGLCSPKEIDCERRKGRIELTKPSSKQTQAPAQHTPGPWKAQGAEIIAAGSREAWQSKIAILPTTIDPRPTLDAAAKTIEERDANARLIAAAPEMLAALMELCADNYLADPINSERMKNARAAIARAKGDRK